MTLPVYALPFANTKAVSPVVVRVGDTKPVVVVTMVDGAGEPVDSADWAAVLEAWDPTSAVITIDGQYDAETLAWYFPWETAPDENELRSEVKVVNGPDTVHYPGPRVYIYDPATLWADPQTVIALAGGDYTTDEAVVAIMVATEAVRAWATVPVPSPVPESVRGAVAILAARVLTTPTGNTGQQSVISERIGDYNVRYAEQGEGLSIQGSSVEALLGWLHPSVYETDIGPKDLSTHSVSLGYAPVIVVEDEEEIVP